DLLEERVDQGPVAVLGVTDQHARNRKRGRQALPPEYGGGRSRRSAGGRGPPGGDPYLFHAPVRGGDRERPLPHHLARGFDRSVAGPTVRRRSGTRRGRAAVQHLDVSTGPAARRLRRKRPNR